MLGHRLLVRSLGCSGWVRSVTPSPPSGALTAQGPARHWAVSKQGPQSPSWAVGFSCFLPLAFSGKSSRGLGPGPRQVCSRFSSPSRLLALRPTSAGTPATSAVLPGAPLPGIPETLSARGSLSSPGIGSGVCSLNERSCAGPSSSPLWGLGGGLAVLRGPPLPPSGTREALAGVRSG